MNSLIKVVFLISNEPWGEVWFSKHHYANELSKLGHTVYFINAPVNWHWKDLFNSHIQVQNIQTNLSTVDYRNPFPVRVFPKMFMYLNDWIVGKRILNNLKNPNNALQWTFDPLRFALKPLSKHIIYHVADPYMDLLNNDSLATKSKLVVCTSPKYINYYTKLNPKTICIQHGISKEEYDINQKEVENIRLRFGDFHLAVGTINDDWNLELLEELGNQVQIILVGPKSINYRFKNPNIIEVGAIHAKQLKNWIAASSVCLVPYKFELKKSIGSRSPLKVLNYMIQEKPIVTSIDPEIPNFESYNIHWAKSSREFIDVALSSSNKKSNNSDYLKRHEYPTLIKTILNELP